MTDHQHNEPENIEADFEKELEQEPDTSGKLPTTKRPTKMGVKIAIGALCVIGALLIYNQPGSKNDAQLNDSKGGGNAMQASSMREQDLGSGLIDGRDALPSGNALVPDAADLEKKEAALPPVPLPVVTSTPIYSNVTEQEDPLRQQIRQQKLQLLQSAAQSSSSVAVQLPRKNEKPTPEEQVEKNIEQQPVSSQQDPSYIPPDNQRKNRWDIAVQRTLPTSPYTLRVGWLIPAVLTTEMNSDLPGQVEAIVSQNVYDTSTGRYLLIPQGTKLVGTYASQPAYGQKRVKVGWERLTFPDGSVMDIGSMPATTFDGVAGMKDQYFSHFWRILGSALMVSVFEAPSYAGSMASMGGGAGGSSGQMMQMAGSMASGMGSQIGGTMAMPFQRNLNVSPTQVIRSGYSLNVMINKDLVFQSPYKNHFLKTVGR